MKKILERLKECIKLIFFPEEREKKDLISYREKIANYQNLKVDELEVKYINLKTEYENKKNILSVFMIAIIISILMSIYSGFFSLANRMFKNALSGQGDELVIAQISFMISLSIVASITLFIIVILISNNRRLRWVYRELKIIENVRDADKDIK